QTVFPTLLGVPISRAVALPYRLGRGVGFLQIDAPVAQLFERNLHAGHRAAHERARPHHPKIAVEIFDVSLAGHRGGTIGTVEHVRLRLRVKLGPAASFAPGGAAAFVRQHSHSGTPIKPFQARLWTPCAGAVRHAMMGWSGAMAVGEIVLQLWALGNFLSH